MAAPTIAGWVGSSIIENLISTAYSYVLGRVLPGDSEDKLKRLQTALPKITAFMGIAEALKTKHPSAGEWLEQFRLALEASEDVLDELRYEELESRIQLDMFHEIYASSSKIRKLCSTSNHDIILVRLSEAVRKLDQAADGVESLLQLATLLGIHGPHDQPRQYVSKVSNFETTSFLSERKMFGRDMEKEKVIGWLQQPTHAPLSSFGIVGVGGVGKTNLAQFVYQEMRNSSSNYFQKIIWVCVSNNFSVKRVTREVLNALQEKLIANLSPHKILLFLDDVWDDENRSEWEQLFAPLRFVKPGSKIIFTTKMISVVEFLSSVISMEHENLALEGLKEQDLRMLFYSYAFHCSNPDDHGNLKPIGDQIVKMLRGIPLAAKAIGSLLNSRMEHHYWMRISNHYSIFNIEQAKNVLEVLKLSYLHLPTDVQVCFRICSIFPPDYLFGKNELIEMWIASGFIRQQSHQTERPEDIGEDYFNHLLRKSFFEYSHSCNGERYVMHDLAQNVSVGECCRVGYNGNTLNIPSTVRHVSVHEDAIEQVSHLENLRTLVIIASKNGVASDLDPFVVPNKVLKRSLRLLKVYVYRSCVLPENTGCLVHLRYLSIDLKYAIQSFGNLLHASVYMLYLLQVLEFSRYSTDSYFDNIETTGITNLVNLHHLRLPGEIMQTTPNVHKLQNLQELTLIVGNSIMGTAVNELWSLDNLRQLYIRNIKNVSDPTEARSANLSMKKNLVSLSLNWGYSLS